MLLNKTYIFLFLYLLSTNIFAPEFIINDDIPKKLYSIIKSKKTKVRKQWTIERIENVSREIEKVAYNTPHSVDDLIKVINHESGFNLWARNKNKNGTYDFGLTQQNNAYAPGRFKKAYKKQMKKRHYFNPVVSVKLMGERFKECKMFTPKYQIACYNSGKKAAQGNLEYYNKVFK